MNDEANRVQTWDGYGLDAIFRPRSIAVIGASNEKGKVGGAIFNKLLSYGFQGPVYPVNLKSDYVHSVKAYPSIRRVPGAVDLAVIVVPAPAVVQTVSECAEVGVKGVIVITAGFQETRTERGKKWEEELVHIVRTHDMRMIGPNCMGVINTEAKFQLDATFAPSLPFQGKIGFLSQSGALGVTILDYANSLNLGVAMFASIGNKADVSGNDFLAYWQNDPNVEVILMYLESFGNPLKFTQLATEVSQKKPIIVVKSGRTAGGARAASSHTGSLAGLDHAFDALFHRCGIIRAASIEEMFDFAMAFTNQPIPKGNRVAIVSNAGGPGIVATDVCEGLGLRLAQLSDETQGKLRALLHENASVLNPVDTTAMCNEETFAQALKCVLSDQEVDAAIVIFVPPIYTDPWKVATEISEVTIAQKKTILGCLMGTKGVAKGIKTLQKNNIPAYAFPESAARSLHAMVKYRNWLTRDRGVVKAFEVDQEVVAQIFQDTQRQGRDYLSDFDAISVFRAYGIPFVPTLRCQSVTEVMSAAAEMGYPVALKLSAPSLIHKSDIGGVMLSIPDPDALHQAAIDLVRQGQARKVENLSFIVQKMLKRGRETILGVNNVPNFGPLIMFGLGGTHVEILKDVAFAIAPLSDTDAKDLVHLIRSYPVLAGIRGEAPVCEEVLLESLLRLSQLAVDFPQIAEIDINPFVTFPEREACMAVDGRIRLKILKGA